MSTNAHSIPRPLLHRLTARTPGVSISQPSPGNRTSCEALVVCRRVDHRHVTSAVRWWPPTTSALTRVLLPTPLAPSSAIVALPAA